MEGTSNVIIIKQHRIYRQDLRANPHVRYVFGDNEERIGYGGQAAEMRDEPNAIGIATLKSPGVFWTDANFMHNRAVLDVDFAQLPTEGIIIWPLDGIGTGLAALEQNAPRTWAYLQAKVYGL
jgi:hypothetical protein